MPGSHPPTLRGFCYWGAHPLPTHRDQIPTCRDSGLPQKDFEIVSKSEGCRDRESSRVGYGLRRPRQHLRDLARFKARSLVESRFRPLLCYVERRRRLFRSKPEDKRRTYWWILPRVISVIAEDTIYIWLLPIDLDRMPLVFASEDGGQTFATYTMGTPALVPPPEIERVSTSDFGDRSNLRVTSRQVV